MMNRYWILALLAAPWAASAETLPVREVRQADLPQQIFFDDIPEPDLPQLPPRPSEKQQAVRPVSAAQALEARINQAVLARDWAALDALLDEARARGGVDGILLRYAAGARLRATGQQKAAIAAYREIAAPERPYVQLDLGLMLAEDKQYRVADAVFAEVEKGGINEAGRAVAAHYRQKMAEEQAWQPSFSMNYEQTDNVNNAASARTIETADGRIWRKTEDSLPKSAHGLRYGLGAARTWNLSGNHYAHLSLDGSGVHYWDAQDFNEQTVRAEAGYRFRDVRRDFGLIPFAEQNWLGGERYNRHIGVAADYRYRFNPQWQLALNAQAGEKHYQDKDIAERYNSRTASAGITASWYPAQGWLVFAGLDGANDDTREREQASWRYGLRAGAVKLFADGLGVRANVRYGRREFKAPGFLVYDFVRRDHEYDAGAALWHNKISWKGITPRLNFRYKKIASNMPAFYSRQGKEWFVSLEKQF
ncbi:MAG: surface lipoprotein assembly modifier [Neisseria sp.]|nr:surface lipoprotein assembly modifier [Neisseria sp.]